MLEVQIQSRYPDKGIPTGLHNDELACLAPHSSSLQCEFSGMNSDFSQIQAVKSIPELMGRMHKILPRTCPLWDMDPLSTTKQNYRAGTLNGTLESITSKPLLYP